MFAEIEDRGSAAVHLTSPFKGEVRWGMGMFQTFSSSAPMPRTAEISSRIKLRGCASAQIADLGHRNFPLLAFAALAVPCRGIG
jgi:hypothetical protein